MIDPHLPFAAYSALSAARFSSLKHLATSASAYHHAITHPRVDTPALAMGRALHAMTLTPEASFADVALWEGGRKAGKDWAAFKAIHATRTILTPADLVQVEAMRASILRHPVAIELLSEGQPEVTLTWTQGGVDCKARVDWLRPDGQVIELKTTRSVGAGRFAGECARYLYHAQAAFYCDGVENNVPISAPIAQLPHPIIIAVEKSAPYEVCVYRVTDDVLEVGRRLVDAWIATVATCAASGVWPSAYPDTAIDLVLPDWATTQGLEDVDESGIEEVSDGSDE